MCCSILGQSISTAAAPDVAQHSPCAAWWVAAAPLSPLLQGPVPGLRSRAMTIITVRLPWQKEGWNLVPPLDVSSAISFLVLATLATCCDLNLCPNIGENPIPWANSESCTSNHGHCTNPSTCPLSLLKDLLTSGDGVVGHKALAAVSRVRTDQQLQCGCGVQWRTRLSCAAKQQERLYLVQVLRTELQKMNARSQSASVSVVGLG